MFYTLVVNTLAKELYKDMIQLFMYLQELSFDLALEEISKIKNRINKEKAILISDAQDEVLNDLFILNEICLLLDDYIRFWHILTKNKFSASWTKLQDVQDRLRIIYRFTLIPRPAFLNLIESQCGEIEKFYPYQVFFSMGTMIEEEECSICGEAVDSFECLHIKGQLYQGNLAYGIVKKVAGLDHVAMVDNPKDKRCVVSFEDTAEQFHLIRYLSGLIVNLKLKPLNFSHLDFKKIKVKHDEIPKVGRNKPCICGSSKKYKKCCYGKEIIEKDHVDIVGKQVVIEELLPNHLMDLNECQQC